MKLNSLNLKELNNKKRKREFVEVLVLEKEKQVEEVLKVKNLETGVSINGFEGGQMPLHMRMPKHGLNLDQSKKTILKTDFLNFCFERKT